MRLRNIAGCSSVEAYVSMKLRRLDETEEDFLGIFELMFSERDNTFYEASRGFRIRKRTYGESRERILRRAKVLSEKFSFLPANSAVGIFMKNGPDFIEVFWAALLSGFCPVLLNQRLPDRILRDTMKELGTALVITDGRRFEDVRNISEEELLPESSGEVPGNRTLFPESSRGSFFYVMSSGTGGHVKCCAYGAAEVKRILRAAGPIVKNCPAMKRHYRGELKQLAFLPFYHIFGLVAVYFWFGFFSRTFVDLPDLSPETILFTVRRHHVTHIFAVPLFWEKVYEGAMRTVRDRGPETLRKFRLGLKLSNRLSGIPVFGELFTKKALREVRKNLFGESVSFLISGGGPVRREILEFFNGIGYHFANGYGMSEIGITSVDLSASRHRLIRGSVGRSLQGFGYRISREGILEVSGDSRARFILSEGRKTVREEWFSTGDLCAEEKGRYYLLGREDELIVGASGENLNPNLYEKELYLPGVREVCILNGGTEAVPEPVLLLSVEEKTAEGEREKLRAAVKEKLREMGLSGEMQRVLLTERELITGDEFKLNRKRLRCELLAGCFDENAPRTVNCARTEDEITETVLRILSETLGCPEEGIREEDDFFLDLQGNSLDYCLLLSKLSDEFQRTFPADRENSLHTVREIREYLKGLTDHGNDPV